MTVSIIICNGRSIRAENYIIANALATRIPSKRPCTCHPSSCHYCMEPTAYTHVVLASSLLSFKNSLKNVDLTYTLFI